MQSPYDPKDIVIKVGTFDRMSGEVLGEKEVVGFADECLVASNNLLESLDFDEILRDRGVGSLYAIYQKMGETGEEFRQRIIEARKGVL